MGVHRSAFSVFVVKNIGGATIISIGIPCRHLLGREVDSADSDFHFLDRYDGERDDFYALVFGLMIIALSSFSFMITQTIHQVYFVQFIKALGFALYYTGLVLNFFKAS